MPAAVTLLHKKSETPGAVPTAAQLTPGEIAINLADKKWFTKTTAGTVVCLNFLTVLDGGEITIPGTATRLQTHSSDNLITHAGLYIAAE
jgi:hypothetical protein